MWEKSDNKYKPKLMVAYYLHFTSIIISSCSIWIFVFTNHLKWYQAEKLRRHNLNLKLIKDDTTVTRLELKCYQCGLVSHNWRMKYDKHLETFERNFSVVKFEVWTPSIQKINRCGWKSLAIPMLSLCLCTNQEINCIHK